MKDIFNALWNISGLTLIVIIYMFIDYFDVLDYLKRFFNRKNSKYK